MRRMLIVAIALLVAPLAASATEVNPREAPVPQIQQTAVEAPLQKGEVIVNPVHVERSRSAEASAMAMQPDRTTWWWVIAAVVIGGLIVVALT
jgi:cytochrome c-type biogenesis protein CcmH/NrfG